jgi:hypothetical protein
MPFQSPRSSRFNPPDFPARRDSGQGISKGESGSKASGLMGDLADLRRALMAAVGYLRRLIRTAQELRGEDEKDCDMRHARHATCDMRQHDATCDVHRKISTRSRRNGSAEPVGGGF